MFSSFRGKKIDKKTIEKTSVCVIGCGPAGMSFLHAIAKRKAEGLPVPQVTCFERASCPGGLWRDVSEEDKSRSKPENAAVMYDDLWCNLPKELMEYHDYTFDTHFKKQTPSFLPRKDILEYIIARNSVDGALDSVHFNTTIKSISYDKSSKKFTIEALDRDSAKVQTVRSDKCIWAAGVHNEPYKPDDVMEMLKDYNGKVIHSVEAAENFEGDVKGKRVMIVGDSCSAEDLALRALKLGAEHIYICARSGDGEASMTPAWPSDKVTVVFGPPYKCLKGTGFKCHAVYWSEKRQKYRKDDEEEPVKLSKIDTVILATGYDPAFDFLPESLQFDDEGEWDMTKGWQMDKNDLTTSIGNPVPSKNLLVGSTCYPDVYRGLLIRNPDMMYIHETGDSVAPIIELDVLANLVLGYITGDVPTPKEKEMQKANQKQLEEEMQIPWLRLEIDQAYAAEIDELPDDHWSNNPTDERAIKLDKSRISFLTSRLARDATDANYPVDFGKWDTLSEKGKRFEALVYSVLLTRTTLRKNTRKTFRDNIQEDFKSIYTEVKSLNMPDYWMNLKFSEGAEAKIENVTVKE